MTLIFARTATATSTTSTLIVFSVTIGFFKSKHKDG